MKKIVYLIFAISILFLPFAVNALDEKSNTSALTVPNEVPSIPTETSEQAIDPYNYDASHFEFNSDLSFSKDISGILFAAGKRISLQGSQEYGFYAGDSLKLDNYIEKDAFVAGKSIVMSKNAIIGRTLYIVGDDITIAGVINGDLNITGNNINLSNASISGDVNLSGSKLRVNEMTIVMGTFKYNDDIYETGLEEASIGSIEAYEGHVNTDKENKPNIVVSFVSKINFVIFNIIFGIAIGCLLLFCFHNLFKNVNENIRVETVLKTGVVGALILFLIPIASIFLLMTIFGIPISFIAIVFYLISIYFSGIMSSMLFGNVIYTKVLNQKENAYISTIIGVVLLNIIEVIPFIGGMVTFASLIVGLGLIYKIIPFSFKEIRQ